MLPLIYFALFGTAVSAPIDKLVTSFSSKQWNKCTSDWITCPAAQAGGGHVAEFTQFYAQDSKGFRDRLGPVSFLPDKENQMLVERFDLGYKYLMWVDASNTWSTPQVINCTRGKAPHVNRTNWALGFTGFLRQHGEFNGTTSCANGTIQDCQVWNYLNQFPDDCMHKRYIGTQPQKWTLAPLTNDKLFLAAFTNDIFYPVTPAACVTSGVHKFWHWDFSNEFSTSIDEALFAVPDDDACPLALDGEFGALLQSSHVRFPHNGMDLLSSPIVV